MDEWITKIRTHLSYMSDIITAVKGQAVTMSEEQAVSFTLDELVKRVNILMKHELKNALVSLNIDVAGISILDSSFLLRFKFMPIPTTTPLNSSP